MYRTVLPVRFVLPAIVFALSVAGFSTSAFAYPTASGTAPTTATVGTLYSFQPSVSSTLSRPKWKYAMLNRPSWASFNHDIGRLYGTPKSTDVNKTFSNIILAVYDGDKLIYMPAFSITVKAAGTGGAAKPPTSANRAPTISGSPSTQVVAATAYLFKPAASDADGDKLTFSIASKPSWAAFDTTTGALSGTPTAAQVGTYSNIAISVSDGKGGKANLPLFAVAVVQAANGRVTVSWTPPTQNTNNTALTNLAGYAVRWGTASGGPYTKAVVLTNPSLSSYVVENLTPGTYYFVVAARNSAGAESVNSAQVTKTIR